jgi:hypothetical protein
LSLHSLHFSVVVPFLLPLFFAQKRNRYLRTKLYAD